MAKEVLGQEGSITAKRVSVGEETPERLRGAVAYAEHSESGERKLAGYPCKWFRGVAGATGGLTSRRSWTRRVAKPVVHSADKMRTPDPLARRPMLRLLFAFLVGLLTGCRSAQDRVAGQPKRIDDVVYGKGGDQELKVEPRLARRARDRSRR